MPAARLDASYRGSVNTARLIVTYRLPTDRGPAPAFGARGLILEFPAYVAGSFSLFSLDRNAGILLYGEDLSAAPIGRIISLKSM
jgi:hypothetical protein